MTDPKKEETCACRFGPNGKETKMCQLHILLTQTLIKAEEERDRLKLTLASIKSAVCKECSGSGEIGLSDGEVPCPKCFGSGDPLKPGVFKKQEPTVWCTCVPNTDGSHQPDCVGEQKKP